MGDFYLFVPFRVIVVADYYKTEQDGTAKYEQQVRSNERGQTSPKRSSRMS